MTPKAPCRYKHYIFDLDGTLTDSRIAIGEGVITALAEMNINGVTIDDVARWIGRPLSEIFPYYMRENGIFDEMDNVLFDRLVTAYRRGHDAHFPSGVVLYPGVRECLARIRHCGANIAVATTKFEEAAQFVMEGIGLHDSVDKICGTDEDKPVKPDPFVIHLALERLDATPSETLVIGDTPADIQAAHAAGCHAAAVSYGFGDHQKMKLEKPEFWLDHLDQLP
ncbi:HAD family hydrolase [bacterium]|nr:HAD family hydrolase [bacterium]